MARGYLNVVRAPTSPRGPAVSTGNAGVPANQNWRPASGGNDNFRPTAPFEPAGLTWADAADLASAFIPAFRLARGAVAARRLALELLGKWMQGQITDAYRGPAWQTFCQIRFMGGTVVTPQSCQLPGFNGAIAPGGIETGPLTNFDGSPRQWVVTYANELVFIPGIPTWSHRGLSNWSLTYPLTANPVSRPWLPYMYVHRLPRQAVRVMPKPYELPSVAPDAVSNPLPASVPSPRPLTVPEPTLVPPMWNPYKNPIASPWESPTTIPIPWRWIPLRRPDPIAPPTEATQIGPVKEPVNVRDYNESRDLEIRTGARNVIRPKPSHRFKPPVKTKGEKEKKLGASGAAYRTIAGAFGKVTEASEFVQALWDALPDDFKKGERRKRHGKAPRLTTKLEQLYQHIDKVDWDKAVTNVIEGQVKDKIIGKFGQASRAEHWGNKPTGRGVPNIRIDGGF